MTNDRYLIVSYFAVAALAIVFAGATWLYLRRSFGGIAQALSADNLSRILKVLFPAGLFLPAFLGFVSVNYSGCGNSYGDIVKARSYLIQKNQEQISSILLWITAAVLFWDFIILFVFRFARRSNEVPGESSGIRRQ
jgi:hypothetical protein